MKQYLLLSNNQQSGPFTIEELRTKNLRPLDLVWIENESTSWEYAGEIVELKDHVSEPERPKFVRPAAASPVFVAMPAKTFREHTINEVSERKDFMGTEVPHIHPPEALKERENPNSNRPIWSRQLLQGNDMLKLAGVFAGVILGAIVMKKAADDLVSAHDPIETNIAQVITQPEVSETRDYQTALVKEMVTPADPKPAIRSVKPKDIRAQVRVKTNDYKTGVFGGVSDLELTAINASPHFIDKLSVNVDFMKKNGELIESKKFTIHNLSPNSTKKLEVPQNRRGAKVKISVQQVYSKEYTAALKQA